MIRRGPRKATTDHDVLPRIRPWGENGGSPHRSSPPSEHRHRRRKRAPSTCCNKNSRKHPWERSRGPNGVLQCLLVILFLMSTFAVFVWRSNRTSQTVGVHHHHAPNASFASLLNELSLDSDPHRRPRSVESNTVSKFETTISFALYQVNPSSHPFVRPKIVLPMNGPDFGGLDIRIVEETSMRQQRRQVLHDFHEDLGFDELLHEADDDEEVESYYAFDDDEKRSPYVAWDDPDIHTRKKCRRTNWHRDLPINCNTLHELDVLDRMRSGDTRYLGEGSYREVYLTQIPNDTTVVFKTYVWGSDFEYDNFEFMRMDAIVNERLNGHPRIVASYGFCGMSFVGEAMTYGDLETWAVPSGVGRIEEPLDDANHLVVGNNLTGIQKLEWSFQMAEAVRLLHGYPGGVIVHDDIQLSQYLMSPSGSLKLNDFNRAEIMLWNEKDFEYCKYRNHPGIGDWRAPEEYYDKPLDESIDIWSLGNNMYSLLTGLYPLYNITEEEVPKQVKHHVTPYIDPRYKERSLAEAKLTEIIPLCWAYEPSQRIDVFQLTDLLQRALKEAVVVQ